MKTFFAVLFFSMAVSAYAEPKHVTARVMFGLDPIGILKGNGTEYNTAYGVTAGLEGMVIINSLLQTGIGFQYQFPRKGYNEYGTDPDFHFYPLYAIVRVRFVTMDKFKIFLSGKIGYTFFREYTGTWAKDGETQKANYVDYTGGGLFVSGVMGAEYNLRNTAAWALDFILETAFEVANAKDTSPMEMYGMNYIGMNVKLGLGLRF